MRTDLHAHIEASGQAEQLLTDPPFKYSVDILSEFLDCAELALRTEGIDEHTVRRVLNTLIYGVSNPNVVIAERLARIHRLDEAGLNLAMLPKGWPGPQTPI